MTNNQKYIFYTFVILTALSGFCIYFLKNFCHIEGLYGPENHFLLDEVKFLHYLLSPILIFSFGTLWTNHIRLKLKSTSPLKVSGVSILIALVILIFSGQGLLGVTGQDSRFYFEWVHLITGGFLNILVAIHRFKVTR